MRLSWRFRCVTIWSPGWVTFILPIHNKIRPEVNEDYEIHLETLLCHYLVPRVGGVYCVYYNG